MDGLIVKNANVNTLSELESIGFDSCYIDKAVNKYKGSTYKIFNLKPHEANILKQLCLSLGFDCAVSRDTVTCKCDKTNALIFGSYSQINALSEKLKSQPFSLNKLSDLLSEQINVRLQPLVINNKTYDWSHPYIMGVLNVTPDSFSDGGLYINADNAVSHALQLINDGADIIDIGGESTRPNADNISVEEEIKRVIPVIKLLRMKNSDITISVDTRNYQTAKAAMDEGADIINDVSGLDYDSKLFEYVTSNNIPVIVMHSDKVPAVSNDFTTSDIVEDVYFSLNTKINSLINAGLSRSKIIADVGIGFGKSAMSCFELLSRHDEFLSLKVPLLLGISRKSFIRNTFGINFDEADVTTALYSSVIKSANIHRVHNVKLTKQYLDYSSKIF
jgi:dihydropteroate synthase